MLSCSSEDDHHGSRVVVCRSLLGATARISQESHDPYFNVSPADRRPKRMSEPKFGRYVESLCHVVPRKLG
jgi:hypothetical protein